MEILPLTSDEVRATGFTHRAKITHADLTEGTANTAQTFTLFTLAAGLAVGRVATRVVTAFEDASDTAFNTTTLIVGDAGDDDRYLVSQEMNANGTEVLNKGGTGVMWGFDAAGALLAKVGSMSAKSLVNIDIGEVQIFFQIIDLRKLAGA